MLSTFKIDWRSPVVIAVTLLVVIQGCSRPEEALRQRATEWGELITRLKVLSLEDAVEQLGDYLEPSAGREARATWYYEYWTRESMPSVVAFSVDEMLLNKQQTSGTVRYTVINQLEDGTKLMASVETRWLLVDGRWYRAIVASQGERLD